VESVSSINTILSSWGNYAGKFEGASPLLQSSFPLSFEGEGDKGGEVEND